MRFTLAEAISEQLTIIFENSCRMGRVPGDGRKPNRVPVLQRRKEENSENKCKFDTRKDTKTND